MPLELPWTAPAALSQQPCLRLAPLLKATYGDSAERNRTMNCSCWERLGSQNLPPVASMSLLGEESRKEESLQSSEAPTA